MASIRLYDALVAESTYAISTTGVWTYTGTPLFAPAPPVAYNDLVDFTGYATDLYEYTYTVTPANPACSAISNTLTVDLRTRVAVPNDECVTAFSHIYSDLNPVTLQAYTNQNLAGSCEEGLFAATLSVDALPAIWPVTTNADLWYMVTVDTTATVELQVVVDGSPFDDNVNYPYITIYSGGCGVLSEEVSQSPSTYNTCTANHIHNTGAKVDYYIRVGCDTGNEGRYNLYINIFN